MSLKVLESLTPHSLRIKEVSERARAPANRRVFVIDSERRHPRHGSGSGRGSGSGSGSCSGSGSSSGSSSGSGPGGG